MVSLYHWNQREQAATQHTGIRGVKPHVGVVRRRSDTETGSNPSVIFERLPCRPSECFHLHPLANDAPAVPYFPVLLIDHITDTD